MVHGVRLLGKVDGAVGFEWVAEGGPCHGLEREHVGQVLDRALVHGDVRVRRLKHQQKLSRQGWRRLGKQMALNLELEVGNGA